MSTASPTRPEKIHALTSLRFFAAFYVVLYHTLYLGFPGLLQVPLAVRAVSLGYISVSFFFLLSGYILAMVYIREGKPVNKRNFYAARFARVYPLFLMTLVADTPFVLLSRANQLGWHSAIPRTAATFAAHLLMLQAWLPNLRGIDQPNWSLSVETLFYVIFPFIAIPLWRLRGLGLWLAALAMLIASQTAVTLLTPHLSVTTIKFQPLLHVCTFALGIVLARWQTLARQRHGQSPRRERSVILAFVVFAAAFAAVIYWENWLPIPNLNAGLLSPIFALLIWACSGSRSLPARILSASWLVVLGEASFGLYLIHLPVLHCMEALHWEHSRALYPVYLATCVGLSLLSFYFVETPTRKWILKRLQTRPKETMETASDAQ